MKELSTEQKAKAYDAAIKRAEAVIKVAQNQKEVYGCVTTILPELSENEDERIRKALISGMNALKENQRSETFATIPIDDCIAWLEKQGEQPVDKIEPKFKVSDWLQYRYAEPFLVEEITEQGYCNGNSCLPFEWEDEIHPWTIQDAKDGDVLMTTKTRNCPFIYRKTDYNNNLAYYYAGVNGNGDFCEGCLKRTMYHFGSVADITPATKEQRDLLFQKMKIAGYEWDSEKKELNKIEVKILDPDKVIEWLRKNTCAACWDNPNEGVSQRIEQFKKDFKI